MKLHAKTIVRILLAAATLGVLSFVTALFVNTRPMSFDAQQWRGAATSKALRYRMHFDLVARLKNEQWSLDDTLAQLGPPDQSFGLPQKEGDDTRIVIIYRVGTSPFELFKVDEISVQVHFEPDGKFMFAGIGS